MSLDKDQTWKKLDEMWEDENVKPLTTKNKKWAIFSDLHMGNGRNADNFRSNLKALIKALEYYDRHSYALILLGDIEELWQFDLQEIVNQYERDIYNKLKSFHDVGLLRIFGNHDIDWRGIWDPIKKNGDRSVFADEGVKMRDHNNDVRLILVHGHQGSIDSDKYTWFSRYWVRMFRMVEPITNVFGLFGHKSATQSMVTKDYERTFYSWAKKNKAILICGHSHRAIFASKSYAETLEEEIAALEEENRSAPSGIHFMKNLKDIDEKKRAWEDEKEKNRVIDPVDPGNDPLPCYFNTGCGLYTDGMTAIEIEDDHIRLVKWNNHRTKSNQYRDLLESGEISKLVARIEAGN